MRVRLRTVVAYGVVTASAVALTVPASAGSAPDPGPVLARAAAPALPGPADVPDPLADGTARRPKRPVTLPRPAPRPKAVAPASTPLVFRTTGVRPLDVPEAFRPWRVQVVDRVDTGVHDAHGARMVDLGGNLHNHPVGQAQYGLQNLNTFRRTGDAFFLDRARVQADRLIEKRVEARGAWFFPYTFDFTLGGHEGIVLTAPWYSGMAQGEATSLFAQLAQVEALDDAARAAYRTAADGAFASLTVGPEESGQPGPAAESGQPWVAAADGDGYLWVEEYPVEPAERSDFTFNGHMFAALGLWDYARLTGSALAERLFDGAATTVLAYAPAIRNPNWYSSYCVAHRVPHATYHGAHIRLLLQMQWLTGRPQFAAWSDRFTDDYPPPTVSGSVAFSAATHTLYTFTSTGGIASTRKITFTRSSSAAADRRIRIKGRGIYYRLTNGAVAGWFAPEAPGRSYLKGEFLPADYLPARVGRFAAGRTYSGYQFDAAGNQTRAKTLSFTAASTAPVNRRAVINGRVYVRVAAGAFAGYWIGASALALDG